MATGVRVAITLACTECKRRNYQMNKSKRNSPDRVEFKKYCRWCGLPHRAPGDPLTDGSLDPSAAACPEADAAGPRRRPAVRPPARPTANGGDEPARRPQHAEERHAPGSGLFHFFQESYGELKKVEWPTSTQLSAARRSSWSPASSSASTSG